MILALCKEERPEEAELWIIEQILAGFLYSGLPVI